ncbi:MAG: hypothetical protein M3Q07_09905 [Pseudobdellovibrionaceae bacterium]|nr:hypothetical protein [Pseudobdellovibrionaceae bacterium]
MQRGSFILGSFGLAGALISGSASAIFVDGHGYYSLRGETRTKPEYQAGSSTFQAVDQFFRLDTELRVNDKSSVFMEFKVFDDEREAFLGDKARPQPCPSGATPAAPGTDCVMEHQNSGEPRYQPYMPKVTKLYAKYAMDYCLLTAGRRGRQWGMGVLLDDGTRPFTTDASVFDGVTCDINIQKSQTLGFSVGYDKIAETGASILSSGVSADTYGPTNNGDDLDQFFLTIEYNDHRANAGKGFSKQIGIYFANVVGGDNNRTDLKIADLYLNFQMQDLVLQNEAVFRLGRSADPSWSLLGGARTLDIDDKVANDLQSIALAGSIEYYLSRSGAYLGPKEYNQGNATSHSIFAGYAYAPGDADGYLPEYAAADQPVSDRDKKVTAFAFHPNFKPALLLFNGRKKSDDLRVDGVFDPYRVMNATVFNAGYRYQSVENGNFEAKFVTAKLNESMSTAMQEAGRTGVGYNGDSLGFEVDLSYTRSLGKELEFGFAGAIGLPGTGWETGADSKTESSYLLQSHATFNF